MRLWKKWILQQREKATGAPPTDSAPPRKAGPPKPRPVKRRPSMQPTAAPAPPASAGSAPPPPVTPLLPPSTPLLSTSKLRLPSSSPSLSASPRLSPRALNGGLSSLYSDRREATATLSAASAALSASTSCPPFLSSGTFSPKQFRMSLTSSVLPPLPFLGFCSTLDMTDVEPGESARAGTAEQNWMATWTRTQWEELLQHRPPSLTLTSARDVETIESEEAEPGAVPFPTPH